MSTGFPPNFSLSEFVCNCSGEFCEGTPPNPDRMRHLAWVLQQVRDKVGSALHINSGYRCPAYNAMVGGSTNSQHLQCRAADIACAQKEPAAVADLAESLMEEGAIPNGGLGRYSTFTHIDIRHDKARWSG